MQKRLSALLFCILFLFVLLTMHLLFLSQNSVYPTLSAADTGRSVVLYQTRGQIYDRNFTPLTGGTTLYTVSFGQNEASVMPGKIDAGHSAVFPMPQRNTRLAQHIIGYCSDGIGVTGIENAYQDLLSADSQTAKATIRILGNGDTLPTSAVTLNLPPEQTDGVVLTLDYELQRILEDAMQDIEKGAAVCIDADSGEILAICSKPTFTDPATALNAPDSPLYNRALAAYPVGSVIKPFIAAAALESGISPQMGNTCLGAITIGNIRFGCHRDTGHGTLNLYGALKESCNPYFIQLGLQLKPQVLLQTLQKFGFGQKIQLAPGITSASGNLPNSALSPGEIANLSFGQGTLSATPLQICAAYAALANGGTFHTPSLVLGTTTDGAEYEASTKPIAQEILSAESTGVLQDALYQAVMESESSLAKPESGSICGKTGTAQTGRYLDGEEILIGWFAGWFETEKNRTVAITVLCEDADSGNANAAPVVREVYERWR